MSGTFSRSRSQSGDSTFRGVVITGRRDTVGAQLLKAHSDLDIQWLE